MHTSHFVGIKWMEILSPISTERCGTLLYNVLVTFRSATRMQQGIQMLAKHGINARPTRPPLGLTSGSCGYGLMVTESDAHRTVKLLEGHRIERDRMTV